MLAGSGAPPPEEIQLKENITFTASQNHQIKVIGRLSPPNHSSTTD
jgi:hypothetical protein